MNIDVFKILLDRNSIYTGDFNICYNFSNISGDILLFNELYPKETQYSNNKIIVKNNPGILVGYNSPSFTGDLGSGYFGGDTILRIGKNLNLNDWTLFLTIKNSGCSVNRTLPRILLSNKKNITGNSGFCFGLNGANKFFIENTVSGETRTKTTNFQGYQSNSISLSKINNKFEISLHDVLNEINTTEEFILNNYKFSNEWFIGNNYDLDNKNYTGFVGYFDDLLLFSGFIGRDTRKNLAKGIFYSGYIPPQVVPKYTYYPIYASTSYEQTGIIGAGITGYQEVSAGIIPTKTGNLNIFELIEKTGFLYGKTIQYIVSTTESGIIKINERIPEQFLIDAQTAKNYSSNYIKFSNEIDEKDILEIYNFTTSSNRNKTLKTYDFETNSIFLDVPYSGQKINLDLNGILQEPGINSISLEISGDYYLNEPQNIYSDNFYELINKDKIIYYEDLYDDEIYIPYSGSQGGLISGNVFGKNLYLNGQKLISGINFTGNASNSIYMNKNTTLADGTIYALNDLGNYLTYNTGYALPPSFNINYVNEKIFWNGVLQELDVDYKKYSCVSLLTGNFIKNKDNNYIIYSNDTGFFNY
jgi:hypothetical protein